MGFRFCMLTSVNIFIYACIFIFTNIFINTVIFIYAAFIADNHLIFVFLNERVPCRYR